MCKSKPAQTYRGKTHAELWQTYAVKEKNLRGPSRWDRLYNNLFSNFSQLASRPRPVKEAHIDCHCLATSHIFLDVEGQLGANSHVLAAGVGQAGHVEEHVPRAIGHPDEPVVLARDDPFQRSRAHHGFRGLEPGCSCSRA